MLLRLKGVRVLKQLTILLKPASSLCNLRCKYCFYADVSQQREIISCGIMEEATVDAILKNLAIVLEPGDRMRFLFQGGEPTLAGLSFFQRFVDKVSAWDANIEVSYSLQTNGILLDEEWCRFLKDNDFLVGVSWDILPDCHDAVRVDATGRGTNSKVLDCIALLDRFGVEYNVLCTLTGAVARHPRQVWKQLCKWDIDYVQFTPCIDEIHMESPYALTPKRFASFYIQLFDLWYEDYKNGKFRSVKLFDDVVNLLVFGRPTACGMNGSCQPQMVVEADGSVYPCDFYCLDEYKLGNLKEQSPMELLSCEKIKAFLNRSHESPKLCETCHYRKFCGGNCKRMQKEICCFGDDTYCGYREFLEKCGPTLAQIARQCTRK